MYRLAVLLAFLPALGGAQGTRLQATRLGDETLVRILATAEVQELNELQPALQKELSLRLYSVAVQGPCVSGTHWVCQFDYYLAVSEYDEYPAQAVYALGRVGEIVSVEWFPSDHDRARLQLTVSNYSLSALEEQKTLQRVDVQYRLEVSVAGVRMSEPRSVRP